MTPVSDQANSLLGALFAAIEAKPDERRSFCIARFINAPPIVIHKGLVGGRLSTTDGVVDEVVGAGLRAPSFFRPGCVLAAPPRCRTGRAKAGTSLLGSGRRPVGAAHPPRTRGQR